MAAGPGGAGGRAEAYRDIAQSVADVFRECPGGAARGSSGAAVEPDCRGSDLLASAETAEKRSKVRCTELRSEWSCWHSAGRHETASWS